MTQMSRKENICLCKCAKRIKVVDGAMKKLLEFSLHKHSSIFLLFTVSVVNHNLVKNSELGHVFPSSIIY